MAAAHPEAAACPGIPIPGFSTTSTTCTCFRGPILTCIHFFFVLAAISQPSGDAAQRYLLAFPFLSYPRGLTISDQLSPVSFAVFACIIIPQCVSAQRLVLLCFTLFLLHFCSTPDQTVILNSNSNKITYCTAISQLHKDKTNHLISHPRDFFFPFVAKGSKT